MHVYCVPRVRTALRQARELIEKFGDEEGNREGGGDVGKLRTT